MSMNVLSFPQVHREELQFAAGGLGDLTEETHKLYIGEHISDETDFPGIIGQSSALGDVLQLVEMVAENRCDRTPPG
jgi:transcriptional regulator with GAF, ATPase, and Fis domain